MASHARGADDNSHPHCLHFTERGFPDIVVLSNRKAAPGIAFAFPHWTREPDGEAKGKKNKAKAEDGNISFES